MGRWVMVVALLLMLIKTVRADGPVPEAAKPVTEKYQSAVAALTREHSEQIISAKKRHAEQLDQLIEKAKEAGDLDGVIKLRDEKENVARSEGAVNGQVPTAAAMARRTYVNALKKSEDEFRKSARGLLDEFLKELSDIEKSETKADRITSAQAVRAFRLEREKLGTPKLPIRENSLPDALQGEWVDLLAWSEGVDWAPRGIDWNANVDGKVTKTGITLKRKEFSQLPLPAIIDGNYEMEIEFTRTDGNDHLLFGFPVGLHCLFMDHGVQDNGGWSGLHFIEGKTAWQNNGTLRSPSLITNNQRHRVIIRVSHDNAKANINVNVDGAKDFIKWDGPYSSLTNVCDNNWNPTMIRHPWIGSWQSKVAFHNVRIRMLSGMIIRDTITDADREQDRKNGFVRLVGEKANVPRVGWGQFLVNQIPYASPGGTERLWPLITRDFRFCDDFYGAHAPSRLKCPIPNGAKSFSAIGYNDSSRTEKYQVYVDGKQVYDSGVTDIAIAKVDIPAKASLLELVIDPAGHGSLDHTNWCYPRFHSVPSDKITEKMLDGKPGSLKFTIASHSVGAQTLTHNEPINTLKSAPIYFRDALPCDEFLYAHAPSSVTYLVPEGMTRFTAIGYNVLSHHVKYEVWADAKRIYESPQAGVTPIDIRLPPGTKTLELKVNDLGDRFSDHSMWCFPRLYRK